MWICYFRAGPIQKDELPPNAGLPESFTRETKDGYSTTRFTLCGKCATEDRCRGAQHEKNV
eukprot:5652788-Lingulodinium_polyedra.AAC.1